MAGLWNYDGFLTSSTGGGGGHEQEQNIFIFSYLIKKQIIKKIPY